MRKNNNKTVTKGYRTQNGVKFSVEGSKYTQEKVLNLLMHGEYKTNYQLRKS